MEAEKRSGASAEEANLAAAAMKKESRELKARLEHLEQLATQPHHVVDGVAVGVREVSNRIKM